MTAVTVSSKYQVVIPREVRESMDLQPGTRVQVLQYGNRIELIPLKEPKTPLDAPIALRGSEPGKSDDQEFPKFHRPGGIFREKIT